MLFGHQQNKDYLLAAAEIIMYKRECIRISKELLMVSEAYFKTFAIQQSHFEIIDKIIMYRNYFYIIKIEKEEIHSETNAKTAHQ